MPIIIVCEHKIYRVDGGYGEFHFVLHKAQHSRNTMKIHFNKCKTAYVNS